MALEESSMEKQEAGGLTARGRGKHDTHGHHPTQQTRGSWSEEQQHRRTPSVGPHTFIAPRARASLRNKTKVLPREETPNLATA